MSSDKGKGPDKDRVLGHADEADGIEEYDNKLPAWWLGIFYFTVIWGAAYAVHYHFIGHRSQAAEYDAEVAAANERWPVKELGVELTPEAIAAGETVFTQNCVACHKADLTGGIGPSLVDATWIHGSAPKDIQKTVTEGVAAKGMPAWGPMLGPDKVAAVSAYIVSKAQAAAAAAPPAPVETAPVEGAPAATPEAAAPTTPPQGG